MPKILKFPEPDKVKEPERLPSCYINFERNKRRNPKKGHVSILGPRIIDFEV